MERTSNFPEMSRQFGYIKESYPLKITKVYTLICWYMGIKYNVIICSSIHCVHKIFGSLPKFKEKQKGNLVFLTFPSKSFEHTASDFKMWIYRSFTTRTIFLNCPTLTSVGRKNKANACSTFYQFVLKPSLMHQL